MRKSITARFSRSVETELKTQIIRAMKIAWSNPKTKVAAFPAPLSWFVNSVKDARSFLPSSILAKTVVVVFNAASAFCIAIEDFDTASDEAHAALFTDSFISSIPAAKCCRDSPILARVTRVSMSSAMWLKYPHIGPNPMLYWKS